MTIESEVESMVENAIEFMKNVDKGKQIIFQVSTGWDNTPRYGKNGYLVNNASPDLFKYFLRETKTIAEQNKFQYIFLVCWNEWCEGLVLEPTEQDNYSYLEAVKEVFNR